MNKEEYLELLEEAREWVDLKHKKRGIVNIYSEMVESWPYNYSYNYSLSEWFMGPWLEHHLLISTLREESES